MELIDLESKLPLVSDERIIDGQKFEYLKYEDGFEVYLVNGKEVSYGTYLDLKREFEEKEIPKKLCSDINHPDHYVKGRQYEAIDVIEDWELGFHLGNALKYISRAGRKGDYLEDLKKAVWYLEREISRYQE